MLKTSFIVAFLFFTIIFFDVPLFFLELTFKYVNYHQLKFLYLQVNDLVRDKLTNTKGEIPLWAEVVAGGCVSIYLKLVPHV